MAELFENLGINWKLLLAQVVNFLLLLWLLNRFVFRKLLGYLEERRAHIAKGVEMTERAKLELQRIQEIRNREIERVRQEGELLLEQTRKAAEEKTREMLFQAKAREEAVLLAAKHQAERMKEDILREARQEIEKSAVDLAQKVLVRAIRPEDEERFLKEALAKTE